MDYNVPGVYVEEVSTLPPSVAGVATAIPAFVGYTEKALNKNGVALPANEVVVKRIDTFLEYEQFFGSQPKLAKFALEGGVIKRKAATGSSDAGELHSHLMYYALRMFFDNGGGSCYIVSVGRYDTAAGTANAISASEIQAGIAKLEEFDEPTLVVLPDAVNLPEADYYNSCVQVLNQCNDLKDRFGIFDVLSADTDASSFRQNIGSNHLKYGAAYTPYLNTSLAYQYDDADVNLGSDFYSYNSGANGFLVVYKASDAGSITPKIEVTTGAGSTTFDTVEDGTDISLTINAATSADANAVLTAWAASGNSSKYNIIIVGDGSKTVATKNSASMTTTGAVSLANIKEVYTALYNQTKASMREQRVVLPSSAAIAGVYASVDRDRGVWKAPANVSVNSVIEPSRTITNAQQGRLNVDATSGKSINVIRSFSGRGTLV